MVRKSENTAQNKAIETSGKGWVMDFMKVVWGLHCDAASLIQFHINFNMFLPQT